MWADLRKLRVETIVDFLLNLGNELVRLMGGYAVILSPVMIPLAPVSIITLMLYGSILTAITEAWLRLAVSLLVGLALESFALACLIVSQHAERFNLTKEKEEPRLNQDVGGYALAAYIILGMGMVIVGEILPHYEWVQDAQIARWTLLGFFLLAPFGHWVFATEHNIRRLEARRRERKAEAQANRENDLKLAEQEAALRERETQARERESQAQAVIIQAQAEAGRAEAEIIKQRAALARAEAKREQAERSVITPERSLKVPELNHEREEQLSRLLEHSRHEPFGPADGMERAGLSRKQFYSLMEYAQGRGYIEHVGRGQYIYTNGKEK
jgi:hypothetical protein